MQNKGKYLFPNQIPSPSARLAGTAVAEVRWTTGFWRDRFDTCRDAMVPAMWEILADDKLSHAYANFRIAAGDEEGAHEGPPFWDGDLYKWLEAAVAVHALDPRPELRDLIDKVVDVISRSQRDDGYIHTPVVIEERLRGNPGDELRDHLNFEMYNMGHLMTTACLHRAVTGDTRLFETAVRACDYMEKTFEHPSAELARHSICPSHFMGLADMFRVTGESRYLLLLEKLFNMRDLREGGEDQNQDRIPFREQAKAIGHSVRANYLYAGVADLYAETGEKALLGVLKSIWKNLVYEKMYITGACGALYDGASPDGSSDHYGIQLIHQAYGREYQLPNVTAYNETCANIGNMLWNWRMYKITADGKYADIVELTLLNSVLSGISLDGTRYFYANALERSNELPFPLRWSREREPFITSFCCPPNTVRTIAQASCNVYSVSDRAVWTGLYGACEATLQVPGSGQLRLRQETDYPFDGAIEIEVQEAPSTEVAFNLRIPAWAEEASVHVNSDPCPHDVTPGKMVAITRIWKSGDKVSITLPMMARLMEAHPLIEEDRNQVAVVRGPVVYCLESADLPQGVSIRDIYVRPDVEFTPIQGSGLLSGLVLLRCSLDVLEGRSWNGTLYRPLARNAFTQVEVTLVPYFAWDNRGKGEMAVWMNCRR